LEAVAKQPIDKGRAVETGPESPLDAAGVADERRAGVDLSDRPLNREIPAAESLALDASEALIDRQRAIPGRIPVLLCSPCSKA